MHILWITNKYLDGGSLSLYYPDFLKSVEDNIEKSGSKISFIFFSDKMRKKTKTQNNFFYNSPQIRQKEKLQKTATKIENDYQFTFKQAYFPELIQVSKTQDNRKINLPEKEFNDLHHLIPEFLYLEKIITKEKVDVVFCDQSPEVEMELARAICLKKKKIFLRQSDNFLGRCLFYQQFEFGKERVLLPLLDKKITKKSAKDFVIDFVKNHKAPYQPMEVLKTNFREFYLPRILHFYRYPQFIKMALLKPYFILEQKILKKMVESPLDTSKPYLFFGFHLPTESTVTLRALPYMNQISLIESISRVLPVGFTLYVREHPHWKEYFSFFYLKKVRSLPNIKVLSADIPIYKILQASRGILTYNATTGIETLMYGKPVLSFAPNVYHNIHPAADYCADLYDLGAKLTKLINTSVKETDTYEYIYKTLRASSKISLCAGSFLSKDDSLKKASVFSQELLASIEYAQKNKRSSI